MTYCDTGDLLLGNVPTPSGNVPLKYIEDAANEMDSRLGVQYVTPIVLDESNPKQRPFFLLLKRINAWLASGRLLMALDGAGEDDQLHQYAEYLVKQATAALQNIEDGTIIIPGADPVNPDAPRNTGPLASFADDYSLVESYDSVFGNRAKQSLERPVFFGTGSPYTW